MQFEVKAGDESEAEEEAERMVEEFADAVEGDHSNPFFKVKIFPTRPRLRVRRKLD